MTGLKQEEEIKKDQERSAARFRQEHNISIEEWNLAEEMANDLGRKLHEEFWKLWEVTNGSVKERREGEQAITQKVQRRKPSSKKQASKSH